jgi:hypothetical protein
MLAVGDTLVVGLAGRPAGLNPLTVARALGVPGHPRGINDVLTSSTWSAGSTERQTWCARALSGQHRVNAGRGNLLWTTANGVQGIRRRTAGFRPERRRYASSP